ncbi:helix-turn-helix transcriptional regulator [Nonomuraea sp. NBC_01738]|uniref:helix-turn-helix transcriptional regulator n=1 Tax=Nonomuraea sp. NBC_01738 TaxID=2976003 RepID=UPI002E130E29|nr:helix-turn-helix transcriptional regulator [Nonomuraea sp. NBC_01738]
MKRTDLAAFLRTRRERVTPDMVGLAPGPRRRTPGLRREEVAQLAGVGVTWYTWLEQGRPINASTQVLDAIARTLRLDTPERQHLFRLAGHQEIVPDTGRDRVTCEIREILDQLNPMPASVASARHDILAWNAAYAAIFPEIADAPECERNSIWLTFTHPNLFTKLVNRERELAGAVAVFRGAHSRHSGDPHWDDLIRRLCGNSPDFARLWATQDVADPGRREKFFVNEAVGELRFTTTSLYCSSVPDTRMVVYTPADEATRSGVVWLMAHAHETVTHGMLGD